MVNNKDNKYPIQEAIVKIGRILIEICLAIWYVVKPIALITAKSLSLFKTTVVTSKITVVSVISILSYSTQRRIAFTLAITEANWLLNNSLKFSI